MMLSCPEVTPDSPVLTSKAQKEIDDELVALEERMRALRTRRNSISPNSLLYSPCLQSSLTPFSSIMLSRRSCFTILTTLNVLSWLIVGHVCRHWREVALGTPDLCATPFLNSSKATDEMLTRSKMVPLNLRIVVSLLFLHGDTAGCRCIMEFINKLSSFSAPKLQSLALEVWDKQAPQIASIPTSFPAPNLCNLQIKHCDLSWASSILTGLTVLDIKQLSPECLPTLDELISAPRRMPAPHTLALEDALPTLSPHTASLPRAPLAMNVQLFHL
ncbi:hypothetical protein BDR05DRAFT_193493 [Suillus weaverae]|nr:hypothetical protein BDR05DRAFT_193493 [Suillus weaverae]